MKSTFARRHGHERYRVIKKTNGAVYKARREKALHDLEEDLKTGLLRSAGERTDVPLNDLQKERIKKGNPLHKKEAMTEGKLSVKGTKIFTEIEYSRSASIEMKIIDECQGCHRKNLRGLEMDTADGEYGQAKICISCIEDLDINLAEQEEREKTKNQL